MIHEKRNKEKREYEVSGARKRGPKLILFIKFFFS